VKKMPTVHVNVWKGFKQEKINYLIENLTKVFVDLDIPAEAVEILIHEVPQSHWGIGGIPASEKFKDVKIQGWD
jgi:4-oxalocrotonate tautomerase